MADKANLILEASKGFIRGYEQDPKTQDFVPQAHQPIVGDRWTLGWGSTRGVQEGDTVTREEAERLFERDIQSAISDFNSTISQEIRAELGVNESAAVVSFLFNHGNTKRWRDSKARGHLNKLEIPQFIYELTDPVQGFVKAGEPGEKEIVDGLVNRRAAERKLFNAPDVDIGAGIGALSVNGLNQGGIASFRPMGAVPTGVGMPMHMPRPPRGQMPPQGMQFGGEVPPPPDDEDQDWRRQWQQEADETNRAFEEFITNYPRLASFGLGTSGTVDLIGPQNLMEYGGGTAITPHSTNEDLLQSGFQLRASMPTGRIPRRGRQVGRWLRGDREGPPPGYPGPPSPPGIANGGPVGNYARGGAVGKMDDVFYFSSPQIQQMQMAPDPMTQNMGNMLGQQQQGGAPVPATVPQIQQMALGGPVTVKKR